MEKSNIGKSNIISVASAADTSAIVELLNITYRGEESQKGWTTEAAIIKGAIRTDEKTVTELIEQENSFFLKYLDDDKQLAGCVHLKKQGNRMYLGMLSVAPKLQGKGIGKLFLQKAEQYAKDYDCNSIYMQVISQRTELNNWYIRHGYLPTGEKKAFNVDEKYGVPVIPLDFIILEKKLNNN